MITFNQAFDSMRPRRSLVAKIGDAQTGALNLLVSNLSFQTLPPPQPGSMSLPRAAGALDQAPLGLAAQQGLRRARASSTEAGGYLITTYMFSCL